MTPLQPVIRLSTIWHWNCLILMTDRCLEELAPNERLHYYQKLWGSWLGSDEKTWELIEKAVVEA
jgi:hypothetical protein